MKRLLRSLSATLLTGLLLAGAAPLGHVHAQTDTQPAEQRVLIREVEPFVFVNDGVPQGFGIDLWNRVAQEAGIPFKYDVVETLEQQLDQVEAEDGSLALGALSITEAREERVDFSYPYFRSGLGILVLKSTNRGSPVLGALRAGALSFTLLRLFVMLGIVVLVAAHVMWLIERRKNPSFPRNYFAGVWEGLWWSVVTVTTVGYGDRTPSSTAGRFFALLWMFSGVLVIAHFTASVTAHVAVNEIRGVISGPQDLSGKQIATVDGSTAEIWLSEQRITSVTTATLEEAYTLLADKQVQAVVYDDPILRYFVTNHDDGGDFELVGPAFERQDYGIAFAQGSPLRERINLALLRLIESGAYDRIYEEWFGVDTHR